MDGEGEIVALDAGVEADGVFGVERGEDVVGYVFGGGGGESEDGRVVEGAAGFADGEEGGTEVVSPLGDGVGFVDDEQRDAAGLLEFGLEVRVLQSLGGDVDQLGFAGGDVFRGFGGLGDAEGGVELLDGDIGVLRFFALIFHEREQGRDDDHGMRQEERGELEGERFAGSGGHDGEGVAAVQDGLDDLALAGAEALNAEALAGFVQEFWPGEGLGMRGCFSHSGFDAGNEIGVPGLAVWD